MIALPNELVQSSDFTENEIINIIEIVFLSPIKYSSVYKMIIPLLNRMFRSKREKITFYPIFKGTFIIYFYFKVVANSRGKCFVRH